jgi:hypothetical protein
VTPLPLCVCRFSSSSPCSPEEDGLGLVLHLFILLFVLSSFWGFIEARCLLLLHLLHLLLLLLLLLDLDEIRTRDNARSTSCYICICMYVCMYAYIYIYIYMYVYTFVCICMYVCMYVCMYM